MNTGQMMIGILAMGLVTLTILNFNKDSINTQDLLIYNKEFIIATTVAQSILDEISGKEFDEEIVIGSTIVTANDFSSILRKEGSEVYPNFDDVDDYNNFSKTDTIPGMGIFDISIEVYYMTDAMVKTTSKTYNKNVTIKVTNSAFANFYTQKVDTLVLSSLFSQWKMM